MSGIHVQGTEWNGFINEVIGRGKKKSGSPN